MEIQQRKRSGKEIQYDEHAKSLIGNKIILAHIIKHTIEEFKEMDPRDIVEQIEGEPYISKVPTEPGWTNTCYEEESACERIPCDLTEKKTETGTNNRKKRKDGKRIVGLNTEQYEFYEGMARFDIIFYLRLKDGLSQIIINIEIQKDEPTSYKIVNRATFYVSRMVSSQKERDFVNMNYDDIKPVYSIWICMNMEEDSLNHIHMINESIYGDKEWKENPDIQNIYLIGLSGHLEEKAGSEHELHRLLKVLFSTSLMPEEKTEVMRNEYQIEMNKEIREEVDVMCNLSMGIREEGEAIGEVKGRKLERKKIFLQLYKNGMTIEQIAAITEADIEEIKEMVMNNTL